MRIVICMFCSVLAISIAGASTTLDSERTYTADSYVACAACHLADGTGVPGAFPPIRNRTAAIELLDGGRDYLITVVSYGLMGSIDVAGVQYFGVMAGNSAAMSTKEIAEVLNYVVYSLNDADVAEFAEFSAEEVENVQSRVASKSPAAAGEIRKSLTARYGDNWP